VGKKKKKDGHEHGKKILDPIEGIKYQITVSGRHKTLGSHFQVVLRNLPQLLPNRPNNQKRLPPQSQMTMNSTSSTNTMIKIACLEDFMQSEESFYEEILKIFQWLKLPISYEIAKQEFSDMNLNSPLASKITKQHSTANRAREEESAMLYKWILKNENQKQFKKYIKTDYYDSLRDLSNQISCWDWSDNSRGEKMYYVL
jgi:hypothetical protein